MNFCINPERVSERIEELEEFIHNFPQSFLVPIHKKEIAYLQDLLERYG